MRAIPEFTDRDARLALMDRMHIEAIVNFPTLASIIEVNFMDDPVASQVLIHAFNQWMYDEWGFDYEQPDLHHAGDEPRDRRGRGARSWSGRSSAGRRPCSCGPAPVAGFRGPESPFLPDADPFWARVQEAGIPVMFHASDSGYAKYANEWTGSDREMRPFEPDVFSDLSQAQRPIMDTIFSAVGHGMLSRFPGVRHRLDRVRQRLDAPGASRTFDVTYGKMPQLFAEHPLDVLKRALYVAPYWEDPLEPLIDAIGFDHILFNSDWPHPEGIADPNEYALYVRDEVGAARRTTRPRSWAATCST